MRKRWLWLILIAVTITAACTRPKPAPPLTALVPTPERIAETAVVTAIPVPEMAPVVAEASGSNKAPVFFDGDDCPPERNPDGCSLDVGVNANQIGLAFGWHLKWPFGGLDAGGGGCDLVVLLPGWYENYWLLDGRYEVYDLPQADRDGWIRVLATQRADEQSAHYQCPKKNYEDIPQWDSGLTSPPLAETTSTPTTKPEACERRATGQNQSLYFEAEEEVYGWRIRLDTGEECDGGECYLPSAPNSGEVISGVICPWAEEVQGVEVWDPTQ